MSNSLLKTEGISKYYNGHRAIEEISLEISPGEVHGLIGENGAGKSTLIKILTGLVQPSQGTVHWEGKEVKLANPEQAIETGIVAVHQELTLVDTLTVSENIWLGHEPRTRWGTIDFKKMAEESKAHLDQLGITINVMKKVQELSLAEKQLVELVKALTHRPRLLILDEATSTLGEHEVEKVFHIVRQLAQEGKSIVFVSHRMKEIFQICDTCTIFKDGEKIASSSLSDIGEDQLIEWMTGRKVEQQFPPKNNIDRRSQQADDVDSLLSVKGLSTKSGLHEVDFSLAAGEILGIGGLQGHGQLDLIHALFGMEDITSGVIQIAGQKVRIKNPQDAVLAGIQLVPQDRKKEGVFVELPVSENLIACSLPNVSGLGIISRKEERAAVSGMIERLKIKVNSSLQLVKTLSGGNQQKIALGRWLLRNAKILMLIEPTRGIDINTKIEIYALLRELTHKGYGVIVTSTESIELMGLCDRVMVLYEHRLVETLAGDDITEQKIVGASFGERSRKKVYA